MKNECEVTKDKDTFLICFCRCCHLRFQSLIDLEEHLESEADCWPSDETIDRLEDIIKNEKNGVFVEDRFKKQIHDLIRLKEEKVSIMDQLKILGKQDSKENHLHKRPRVSEKDPRLRKKLHLESQSTPLPPPNSPIISPSPIKFVSTTVIPDYPTPPDSPDYTPEGKESHFSPNKELFSWSPPQVNSIPTVFHHSESVNRDLFNDRDVDIKNVSEDNCKRSFCFWTDSHIENCRKPQIMNSCSTGLCQKSDLHRTYPPCQNLEFACNVKLTNEGQVVRVIDDHVKQILTAVPFGQTTQYVEANHVPFRHLYTTSSENLKDPRVVEGQKYPRDLPKTFTMCFRRESWIIYSWKVSEENVRINCETNPFVEHEEFDEIEILNS